MKISDSHNRQVIPLVRAGVNTLFTNPVIFSPFMTMAFIQLLLLEILYFAPRYPLSVFFGPLIRHQWGELYVHFPFFLSRLASLYDLIHIPIYLLLGGFFTAGAIRIIFHINTGMKTGLKSALKEVWPQYIHVVIFAIISLSLYYGLQQGYGQLVNRAMQIRSESGFFYMMKVFVIQGAPFVYLLMSVFVTGLLAFVLPVIVIDQKKIFPAFMDNFKLLKRTWPLIFLVVFIPMLLYIPILLMRLYFTIWIDTFLPVLRYTILMLGIIVMMFIEAVIYTSVTTYYLIDKES
jgi:hypothetical protein